MKQQQYVGLDVSLEQTSVCVVDDSGAIWRGKCRSTPESIHTVIAKHAPEAVLGRRQLVTEDDDSVFGQRRSMAAWVVSRAPGCAELTVDGGPRDAMGRAARTWQLRRCI